MKHPRLTEFVLPVLFCGLSGTAVADLTLFSDQNHELNFYGFAKLDATYQSDETNSLVAPRLVTSDGDGAVNLTAMHSRFGFRWNGPSLANGFRTGAVLEFDLFDPDSNNQMQFRDRLAAFTLTREETQWLFGQHWDVFSPLNPTTLMTNGNLWNTGNLGFRRAQVRWSGGVSKKGIEWAVSANDPSSGDTDPNSETPILEGRLGLDLRGFDLGISGALGEDETAGSEDRIAGVSVDWIAPLAERFVVKGEAALGENLDVFLSRSSNEQDVFALWIELVQNDNASNDWWVGLGLENVDDVATGAPEDTRVIFGGYQWKLAGTGGGSPVRLGVEGARFSTDFNGGDDESATQVIFATDYRF